MALIIIGVILVIAGGGCLICGSSMNNNMDLQLDSLFNYGRTNPGSTLSNVGLICIILGVIFVVIGIIVYINKKKRMANSNQIPMNAAPRVSIIDEKIKSLVELKNKGLLTEEEFAAKMSALSNESSQKHFCSKCGKPLNQYENFCPICGNRNGV